MLNKHSPKTGMCSTCNSYILVHGVASSAMLICLFSEAYVDLALLEKSVPSRSTSSKCVSEAFNDEAVRVPYRRSTEDDSASTADVELMSYTQGNGH